VPGWGAAAPGRPHRRRSPVVIYVGPGYGYGYGYYGAPYGSGYYYDPIYADSTAAPSGPEGDAWARDRSPSRTYVVDGVGASDAGSVAAEPLANGTLVRVRWAGGAAQAVTLVIADGDRRVLAAQTASAAPYTAVFDGAGRVAFVGATVVRPDGVSTTTLVPLAMALQR